MVGIERLAFWTQNIYMQSQLRVGEEEKELFCLKGSEPLEEERSVVILELDLEVVMVLRKGEGIYRGNRVHELSRGCRRKLLLWGCPFEISWEINDE